jgi:hypothetical protein
MENHKERNTIGGRHPEEEMMMSMDLDYSYRDEAREAQARQLREAAKRRLCPTCPKLTWCSPHEVCVEVRTMEKSLADTTHIFPISRPSAPEAPGRIQSF